MDALDRDLMGGSQSGKSDLVDLNRPNVARVYDYLLGGEDSFAADRVCARRVISAVPLAREIARANRTFLRRVVRFLAGEAGIGQFIDIGAGLPTQDNVHQVAQRANPASRVVYVDNDPVVLVHARALLARDAQTRAILRDVRRPGEILADRDLVHLLDLSRPVAVLLVAVLHFIPNEHDAYAAVRTLIDAMAPGSYLVISHVERCPELEAAARHYEHANAPAVLRSVDEIARFFGDLDMVTPGLVNVQHWRPDNQMLSLDGDVPCYGGIGVKR